VSVQPITGAALEEGPAGPVAAAQRIQHLQAMIASVEAGPAGFAAQLKAAQSTTPGASATVPSATTPQGIPYPLPSGSSALQPATATAPAGTGGSNAEYDSLIEQAAVRNGVDPAVLHGLIQQESGFNPNSTSSAGAVGLTQLMPGTATSLGVTDPLDPAQSIDGGARYLGQMLRDFGGNTEKALAAYNAGPGAVQRYGGVPPYAETQQYVTKVLGYAAEYRQAHGTGQPASPSPLAASSPVAAASQAGTYGASEAAIA
jgi:soluble lytic murein transglycosylase-like protein